MRQDIIDSINRMDGDALIDVAFTFNLMTVQQKDTFLLIGLRNYKKDLKKTLKQKALADENIAEYVLLY